MTLTYKKFWLSIASVLIALLCASCNPQEREDAPNNIKSSISSSSTGGVGVYNTVSVVVANSSGYGISNTIPVISAVNSSGSSSAITAGTCSLSDKNGRSTCTIKSSSLGTYTLKILSPVKVTGSNITFVQTAVTLSVSQQPACASSCTSLTDFTTQPKVQILDGVGNLLASDSSTVVTMALTTAGSATLGGTLTATASSGVATFTNLKIDIAGTYTLTASGDSLTSAVSSAVTIIGGTASKIGFTTQPSSSTAANVAFATQPTVAVQDASGNTVTGTDCNITLSLQSAGGSDVLLGTNAKSTSSGTTTFTNLRISTPAGGSSYYFTATPSAGAAGCAALTTADSSTFAITLSGLPYQLQVSTDPGIAALNQIWPTQPKVKILDYYGNAVGTDNSTVVTVSIDTNPGTGTLGGSTSVTAVNGVVSFGGLYTAGSASSDAGTFVLAFDASNPSVASIASTTAVQTITSNGLTPNKLSFLTEPTNTSVDAVMSQVQVQLLDSNGFLCTNDSSTDITLSKQAGTGALGGTLTQTAVNGIASFSDLTMDTSGGGKQLHAASGALTTVNSAIFSVASFGTAAKTDFTVQPAAVGASAPADFATQPEVSIQDAAGNVVTNDNSTVVTITCAAPSTCNFVGTTSVTAVNGVAVFTNLHTTSSVTNITLQAAATTSGGTVLLSSQSDSFTD